MFNSHLAEPRLDMDKDWDRVHTRLQRLDLLAHWNKV